MAKPVSVRIENEQKHAIEDMVEDGAANTESEALRLALRAGLTERGYLNGYAAATPDTSLRALCRELARVCGYSAIGYSGAAMVLPVTIIQQWVLVLLLFALGFLVVDQLLESHEPAVSRRLFGWVRGREVRADGGGGQS